MVLCVDLDGEGFLAHMHHLAHYPLISGDEAPFGDGGGAIAQECPLMPFEGMEELFLAFFDPV